MTESMSKALAGAMMDRWGRVPADTHRNVKLALQRRGLVTRDAGYNFVLTGSGAIAALDEIEGR